MLPHRPSAAGAAGYCLLAALAWSRPAGAIPLTAEASVPPDADARGVVPQHAESPGVDSSDVDSLGVDSPDDPPAPEARSSKSAEMPRDARTSADLVLDAVPASWRDALGEILERDPDIARAHRRAVAAELRAPQLRSLPDPKASLGLFVLPPETRVGPQRLSVALSQRFPWFGTLETRERRAVFEAAAAREELEELRLRRLTEGRRLLFEAAFIERHWHLLDEERRHLVHHEEVARQRYAAGGGLQQEVVKVGAEITRVRRDLLGLEARHRGLVARFNRLRDRVATAAIPSPELPPPRALMVDLEALRDRARRFHPSLRRARAMLEASGLGVELAEKAFRPDFEVGFSYTLVEGRGDRAGRAMPPEGNGDDIFALRGSVELPVWRRRLEAGLSEALELRRVAEASVRSAEADIEAHLGDCLARLPLIEQQWRLAEEVLEAQALWALRSAEEAYAAGNLGALEVLHAEHMLFHVRLQAARAAADHAVLLADLEAAIGIPLEASDRAPSDVGEAALDPRASGSPEVSP